MKLPNLFSDETRLREYQAGDTIFEKGQPGDEMFIVHGARWIS
jgi:CRP-like cAMP-binding protein